jgi:predicted restriction endonuclease
MVSSEYSSRNRYQKIRAAAVRVSKRYEARCSVCGYAKFVEVAHIKGIATFPPDAKMEEVNSIDNLSFLCRNHHWEFDNGVLESPVKSFAEQVSRCE